MSKTIGQAKVTIGGKSRPIKFGTNATHLFCNKRGIKLNEFNDLFSPQRLQAMEIDGSEIRDLIWAGLAAACYSLGEEVDFNEWTVGDWIDEMTEEDMATVLGVFGDDIQTKKKTGKGE